MLGPKTVMARLGAPPPPPLLQEFMAAAQWSSPPFLGHKSRIFWCFWILSRKSLSGSRLQGVCMGRSGTSTHAVCAFYALFCHFCYLGGFGHLDDPVLPTLRGVSGDVVTVYAC